VLRPVKTIPSIENDRGDAWHEAEARVARMTRPRSMHPSLGAAPPPLVSTRRWSAGDYNKNDLLVATSEPDLYLEP
jgi:hypothetical protein